MPLPVERTGLCFGALRRCSAVHCSYSGDAQQRFTLRCAQLVVIRCINLFLPSAVEVNIPLPPNRKLIEQLCFESRVTSP